MKHSAGFPIAALALAAFAASATFFSHGQTVAAVPSKAKTIAAATPMPMESPEDLLAHIRRVFRSHRPPPLYEVYTLQRKQLTDQGYPDLVESYVYHIWCRTTDHAALTRKVLMNDAFGSLEFQRPLFNEPTDPGPPTADVFEPAPIKPHSADFVPTPEPTNTPQVIATVHVKGEFDYHVVSVHVEGNQLHLSVLPIRDPDRNRLREIWVDRKTLELQKLVATDKLFIQGTSDVYAVLFTINFGWLDGMPVITSIHGVVGDGYSGDGQIIDYTYSDIAFPKSLPDWYFNHRSYAAHQEDAPE